MSYWRTLLVPLDGTPEAAAALPLARTLAAAMGAELALVRVLPDVAGKVETSLAAQQLQRIAVELAGAGIQVATHVRTGSAPDQLLAAIEECAADAVVMATHGRSGVPRAVLGSIAERVLTQSPVPLLLVRPGGRRTVELKTLSVPVDGTAGGALALASAVAIAQATHARIQLVEVVVPVPAWVFAAECGTGVVMPPDSSWDTEALEGAKRYVNGLAARLREIGIAAEGRAIIGDPASMITAMAQEVQADLIVMSTRALNGPVRTVVGSTADTVVRTAGRPVLLVRRRGAAHEEAASAVSAEAAVH